MRQVFARARASSPCIIFFDELDAMVPRRDDSLVSKARLFPTVLLLQPTGRADRPPISTSLNRPLASSTPCSPSSTASSRASKSLSSAPPTGPISSTRPCAVPADSTSSSTSTCRLRPNESRFSAPSRARPRSLTMLTSSGSQLLRKPTASRGQTCRPSRAKRPSPRCARCSLQSTSTDRQWTSLLKLLTPLRPTRLRPTAPRQFRSRRASRCATLRRPSNAPTRV